MYNNISTGGPLFLRRDLHGDIVCRPWNMFHSGAGGRTFMFAELVGSGRGGNVIDEKPIQCQASFVSLNNSTARLVNKSTRRRMLTVLPASQTLQVAPDPATPDANTGWTIANSQAPFVFTKKEHGDLVDNGYMVFSAGLTTVLVIEGF